MAPLVLGIVLVAGNSNEVKVDEKEVARTRPRSPIALTPTGFVF